MTFAETFKQVEVWYHGTTSDQLASLKKGIQVDYRPRNCDFGIGFYMTSQRGQAEKWAKRKTQDIIQFNPNVQPVLLSYSIPKSLMDNTKIFEINDDFFNFIYENRCNHTTLNTHQYSLIFGPVIDGKIYQLKQMIEDFRQQRMDLATLAQALLGQYQTDTQLCVCHQSIANQIQLIGEQVLC